MNSQKVSKNEFKMAYEACQGLPHHCHDHSLFTHHTILNIYRLNKPPGQYFEILLSPFVWEEDRNFKIQLVIVSVSVISIMLPWGWFWFENHHPQLIGSFCRGGGGLPNKGRYRCAASAKPRLGKISPKYLMPGQKTSKNIMGHFFHSYQILHIFCQKLSKT